MTSFFVVLPARFCKISYLIYCVIAGQFMRKGVHLDNQRQMLMFSDGRYPVPVIRDSAMTGGSGKECWKAMNFGNQGEGLIIGKILNYVVPHLLSDDLNI